MVGYCLSGVFFLISLGMILPEWIISFLKYMVFVTSGFCINAVCIYNAASN
jgi:hypothetical protein